MNLPERDRLLRGIDYLADWFDFQFRSTTWPGLIAAVQHGPELLWSQAYGLADVARGIPLTSGHRFRIASQSKMFTATAVFMLAERGLLQVDDRVSKHLDWFRSEADPGLADVTVRQLLSHGAGLTRDGEDAGFWLDRPFPGAAELRDAVTGSRLVIPANTRFKYSNIGYGVLGAVVEAAAGEPYAEFVRRSILRPLGLADTGTDVDESAQDAPMAVGYGPSHLGTPRIVHPPIPTGALAPATGFFSTVADLATFASAHFAGDGRLLTDAGRRDMHRLQWHAPLDGQDYASGLDRVPLGRREVLGHRGAFPGYMSCTRFDPDERIAVSVAVTAQDGRARLLCEAAVGILDFFRRPGLDDACRSRPGLVSAAHAARLFSPWGVTDTVPVDDWLLMVDPAGLKPFDEPSVLQLSDADSATIARAPGFGGAGQRARFHRDAAGAVRRANIAGVDYLPWEDYRARFGPAD